MGLAPTCAVWSISTHSSKSAFSAAALPTALSAKSPFVAVRTSRGCLDRSCSLPAPCEGVGALRPSDRDDATMVLTFSSNVAILCWVECSGEALWATARRVGVSSCNSVLQVGEGYLPMDSLRASHLPLARALQQQEERAKGELGQSPTQLVGGQERLDEAAHQHDQQEAAQAAGVRLGSGLGLGLEGVLILTQTLTRTRTLAVAVTVILTLTLCLTLTPSPHLECTPLSS